MYFTYVVRPGDAPEGKGPQFQPFWDGLMSFNLRGGYALQLAGFLLVLLSSLIGGNFFQVFQLLNGHAEAIKHVPLILTFMGTFMSTIGAVWIQNFRNIADDDASIKQSRGFRGGIKALHQSSLLDIISNSMTTILIFSFMQYFEDDYATKRVGSGSTAIYASVARTLHATAMILYGLSFFFLENFHVEGTAEFWGWSLAVLFQFCGIFEILALTCTNDICAKVTDAIFTILFGMALGSAFLWSLSFEPTVARSDVKMTQSAMRNEFYKSQNAMAYYGPSSDMELPAPN